MSQIDRVMFAAIATVFSCVLLFSLMVYGGHAARCLALFAALAGVVSQFFAQGAHLQGDSQLVHVWSSVFGFVLVLIAILAFIGGY